MVITHCIYHTTEKNMSVSTVEQTDFYKIEPVVYYRFKQGQVVELALPERQAYINSRLLTE